MIPTSFQTIGVIGSGQMGSGIVQVALTYGAKVLWMDQNPEALKRGQEKVTAGLKKISEKGKLSEDDYQKALSSLKLVEQVRDFTLCDLVIEAVSERQEVKEHLFKELDSHLKPSAILASNTSSISITALAKQTERPDKVIGVHFMNPVPVMKLVEVIPGLATSAETLGVVCTWVHKIEKTIAFSKDYPGFIVNRILMPMINEAIYALYEGVGTAEAIDTGMKLGTNHPMGPLELADLIGLDTCLSIMKVLYEGFSDSKYRPCPLLVKYVEGGYLGRKSGKGFYDYTSDPVKATAIFSSLTF